MKWRSEASRGPEQRLKKTPSQPASLPGLTTQAPARRKKLEAATGPDQMTEQMMAEVEKNPKRVSRKTEKALQKT